MVAAEAGLQDDLISTARRRFDEAYVADEDNRAAALDDLEFIVGEQWPESVKTAREAANRPVLTINRMPQFLRQVTGDIRKTNPAIDVIAADSAAGKGMAEMVGGLIRQIEFQSDATSIYEQTTELAASCGIGNWRILSRYENSQSFDQELYIKRIPSPFSVYWDPNARDQSRMDAGYCFITEWMEVEDFKREYPNKTVVSVDTPDIGDAQRWAQSDKVQIAEYYWKTTKTVRIGRTHEGQVVEGVREDNEAFMAEVRDADVDVVMWAKVSGAEVLEGPIELKGRFIPVVAVTGEEISVGERIVRNSVIRYAKDSQRMYNYWQSANTEIIALQPKAPYKVTPKQIAGLETFWNEANDSNRPYLPYNVDPDAPPPMRETPPVPSGAMLSAIALAADDMKATTGIYDASLGERTNETSGVAIRQRQIEADISTSIYVDNLSKSIAQCGRVLLDLIPHYYDTNRVLRIIGKDGKEDMVEVNGVQSDGEYVMPVNDLTIGRYDVRVTTGPSYSTQRQEASESMLAFIQAVPQAGAVLMDLVAKNMDWPGADQVAERLEKMLPPEMQPEPEEITPELAQQMQQAQTQQAQQAQIAQQAQDVELRKAAAEAAEAEADAVKAQAEADKAQMELDAIRAQYRGAAIAPPAQWGQPPTI